MPVPTGEDRSSKRDRKYRKSRYQSYSGQYKDSQTPDFSTMNPGGFSYTSINGMPIPMPTLGTIYNTQMQQHGFDPFTGELNPPDNVVPGTHFERDSSADRSDGRKQGAGLDQVQQLLAYLDQLRAGAPALPTMPTEADLNASIQELTQGIKQQYGSQIGSIRNQNQGARQDVNVGSARVQKLYDALAKSYTKAGKREGKQGEQLSNQLASLGERGQQATTDQASQLNEASLKAAQGLGLADLGSDLVNKTNKTAQSLGNRALSQGQNAAQAQAKIAGTNRTFMNTSGQTARLEGTNRSADMYAQLQDYLQQNRNQISELAGQRAADIAAGKLAAQQSYTGQQSDIYGMQQDAYQSNIDTVLAEIGLAMKAREGNRDWSHTQYQDQLDALTGGGTGEGDANDPYGIFTYNVGQPQRILDEAGRPKVSQAYQTISDASAMQVGKTAGKEGVDLRNPNIMRNWIQHYYPDLWNGLGSQGQAYLLSALQASLGVK